MVKLCLPEFSDFTRVFSPVNPHSTKPCKPNQLTTHLHAYGNEKVKVYAL